MKATLPAIQQVHNGKILHKPVLQVLHVVGYKDRKLHEVITVRIWGTARGNQAGIWVHAHPYSLSGFGTATGGGYHRPSGALHAAILNAGITLSEDIHGVGDSAMQRAIEAIARAAGFRNVITVRS